MRIGKKADLDQGDRNRGIAPGLQLAAINGERGDPLDAFSPLARLFMIGKLASKGVNRGFVCTRLIYGGQPAIKFNAGTGARG